MGCDLRVHEILLVALLGLGVTLYGIWPRSRPAPDQGERKPATQARQHSKDKPPFAGLTTKPHCEACEHAREPAAPPPPPPPLVASRRGRPRELDIHTHYCPTKTCPYYGWTRRGNIRANGHPGGGPWRQLHCIVCETYFLETHGTLFYGKTHAAEGIVRVVAALAEGLGRRAVARVFALDPNTVLAWSGEAAAQLKAFSRFLLREVQVRQVQLDELFAVLSEERAGQGSDAEASAPFPGAPRWVWVALDPESKLLLALDLGQRTLALAQRLVHHVVQLLAPGCVPLFLTDGFKEYTTALLTHFGYWVQPLRRQAKGPDPKPRWLPRPELLYARVVKHYRRRRLVCMRPRVVFGTLAQVLRVLAPRGWHINTAFIERVNLTIRHHVAAVGRRVLTLCKQEAGLHDQLHLYHAYYNFCLPHISLRRPLVHPQPTKGSGSAKRWHPCTPAIAASLTDHVWTVREVLLFRVPPWPQS